jgi:putative SOS response-associated peptidase YedK
MAAPRLRYSGARANPESIVILTAGDEFDTWLSASWAEASRLQRPLPDGALKIVASGEKEDPV